MKRPLALLMAGVAACIVAFACVYLAGTAASREMLRAPQPELAWLKHEFNLSDQDFQTILQLHQAYLPKCAERCRQIAEQNEKLEQLLAGTNTITPEIQGIIDVRAKMRADCEAEMLKHFIAVSRSMPAEQGRRYLAWVERQSSFKAEGMEQRHGQGEKHHHH